MNRSLRNLAEFWVYGVSKIDDRYILKEMIFFLDFVVDLQGTCMDLPNIVKSWREKMPKCSFLHVEKPETLDLYLKPISLTYRVILRGYSSIYMRI